MQPVFTLTGATTFFSTQKSNNFTHEETIFDYQSSHSTLENFRIGGFIGEDYSINGEWHLQFGLAFYQTLISSIRGDEKQAPVANPEAINYWDYEYQLASRQILFESKLLFTCQRRYHPYLLAGLGEGFNRTSEFQVTSRNVGEVATAIYGAHQSASFVYAIGAGVDVDVRKRLRLGVGYRLANVGKHDLGTGTLDTGAGGSVFSIPALKTTETFNHEIFIQLTYFI